MVGAFMKNTQIVAERIKIRAKEKGISVKKLLEKCDLGVNTVTKMSNGTDIVSQNLLKIADGLECSVDYLLGRTENPNIMSEVYVNGNNHGIQTIKGNVNIGTVPKSKETNDITKEFMEAFEKLTLADKADAIKFVLDKMKK